MPPHVGRHNKALVALGYDKRPLKGATTMTTNTYKLANHESAQAKVQVIRDKNNEIVGLNLISYSTLVCGFRYEFNGIRGKTFAFCTGTYSQTTRRHISWFCRCPSSRGFEDEYPAYYDFKDIFENCNGERDASFSERCAFGKIALWYERHGTRTR